MRTACDDPCFYVLQAFCGHLWSSFLRGIRALCCVVFSWVDKFFSFFSPFGACIVPHNNIISLYILAKRAPKVKCLTSGLRFNLKNRYIFVIFCHMGWRFLNILKNPTIISTKTAFFACFCSKMRHGVGIFTLFL